MCIVNVIKGVINGKLVLQFNSARVIFILLYNIVFMLSYNIFKEIWYFFSILAASYMLDWCVLHHAHSAVSLLRLKAHTIGRLYTRTYGSNHRWEVHWEASGHQLDIFGVWVTSLYGWTCRCRSCGSSRRRLHLNCGEPWS